MTTLWVSTESDKKRLYRELSGCDTPYRVEIKAGGGRSLEQNRYLWGVVYETILDAGLREQGWRNSDIHEFFLGECFGWQELGGMGRKRLKPLKRSHSLNKVEFMDYIAFIQEWCATNIGIVIPDPEHEKD